MADEREEKLYLVTYEHEMEPYSSRTTKVSIGRDSDEAIERLLSKNSQRDNLRIIDATEFRLPGYKIALDKLVE
ncbi:MAG: hypothetical protein AABX05_06100 [Nanoarchaeota archaeon]